MKKIFEEDFELSDEFFKLLEERGRLNNEKIEKKEAHREKEKFKKDAFKDAESFTGRYSLWSFFIDRNDEREIDTDLLNEVFKISFDKYKMSMTDVPYGVHIIAYTKVRKRRSTIHREVGSNFVKIVTEKGISSWDSEGYRTELMPVVKGSFDLERLPGQMILDSQSELIYSGKDIEILYDRDKRYPWQNSLLDLFYDENLEDFLEPNDRTVIWVYDQKGCTGKSKFVKWVCLNRPEEAVKITFGTAGQLRSSLITAEAKKCYFLDIPRTIANDDSLESIISSIEDLKNGHLVSNFYGKYKQLLMDPPHVIIFSNQRCPKSLMSEDRWLAFEIKDFKLNKI